MTHDCVYATAGWGIHDDRWLAALSALGFTPLALSLGKDAPQLADFQRLVSEAASDHTPVLAGPLHSVTRALAELPVPVIGLSWGYDLHEMSRDGEDLGWLMHLAGVIVDSTANEATVRAAGVAADRTTLLPWGVDLQQFRPNGEQADTRALGLADLDFPEGASVVLSLRAHEPIYRIDDVIHAFDRLCAALGEHHEEKPYLVIGHQGSLTESLKRSAAALPSGDRIRFIGTVPEAQLAALLRATTTYVTAAEMDGSSVTLLQAMACGALVVASDTPGNLGWVEDGRTGWVFRTGDSHDLARVMQQALTSPRKPITDAALALVTERADWQKNVRLLRHALEGAVAS